LILGWLTDAKILGMYSIAFFMINSLREMISSLLGNVTFPALSEVVRERPEMLKQTYYRFRKPLDVLTLLATGLLFFSGHVLIDSLYDKRYTASGDMLEILSIALFSMRYMAAGQCFLALGKPKLLIPVISIQALALYGLMPIAFAWHGLNGALWVVGGNLLFTLPMVFYLMIKLNLFDMKRELRVLPWLAYGLILGWAINRIASMIGWFP
ncbi:MAG: oligosaccharide flippase family protein, partial [Gallionella sp.]